MRVRLPLQRLGEAEEQRGAGQDHAPLDQNESLLIQNEFLLIKMDMKQRHDRVLISNRFLFCLVRVRD